MGGQQFDTLVWLKDPGEAFRSAVDQALWEHGHGGYTGTIAEKLGFTIRKGEVMTEEQAGEFVRGGRWNASGQWESTGTGDGNDNDKWGKAYAVPVCKEVGGPIEGWLFYGWASS
jgi:hypothetical protein